MIGSKDPPLTIEASWTTAPANLTTLSEADTLVEATAADYVRSLRALGSPLIATDELAAERADYARGIVSAVLASLNGPGDETPSLDTRRMVMELAGSGISPGVALSGAALLFELALRHLVEALPLRNVEIAICLSRHLLFGIALVLDSVGISVHREHLVSEIVDSSRLRATLTNKEAAVFMLLVDNASTEEIMARPAIQKDTLKHHITRIGRKLGGRGRAQVLRRARELGILVAVPLTASATVTALNALSGG